MLKGVLTTFEKEERYFMGVYINPGNSGFAEINDSDYVDKTGLIELIKQAPAFREILCRKNADRLL